MLGAGDLGIEENKEMLVKHRGSKDIYCYIFHNDLPPAKKKKVKKVYSHIKYQGMAK